MHYVIIFGQQFVFTSNDLQNLELYIVVVHYIYTIYVNFQCAFVILY